MKLIWFFIFITIIGCDNSLNKKESENHNIIKKEEDINYKNQKDNDKVIISKKVDKENSVFNLIFRDSLIIPKDIKIFSRKFEGTSDIPIDTLTKNKNYIKYLLTKDSCCSDNIYINWGNDTVDRIIILQGIRQVRSYFIPELVYETDDYLILEHGCASDCWGVLFLPLNNYEKEIDILDIVKYNPQNYTVIKSIDNYIEENEFIEAFNVKTKKSKQIIFKNSGIAARQIFLIDSCNITDNDIYVRANLYDRKNDKKIKEEIRLKNDIK